MKTQKNRFFKLILSTLAAAFGVQTNSNREEDFQQSSALPFIIAGIVFTMVFVLILVVAVRFILA